MAKRQANGGDRARLVLAQEATRIIVEQGIEARIFLRRGARHEHAGFATG